MIFQAWGKASNKNNKLNPCLPDPTLFCTKMSLYICRKKQMILLLISFNCVSKNHPPIPDQTLACYKYLVLYNIFLLVQRKDWGLLPNPDLHRLHIHLSFKVKCFWWRYQVQNKRIFHSRNRDELALLRRSFQQARCPIAVTWSCWAQPLPCPTLAPPPPHRCYSGLSWLQEMTGTGKSAKLEFCRNHHLPGLPVIQWWHGLGCSLQHFKRHYTR